MLKHPRNSYLEFRFILWLISLNSVHSVSLDIDECKSFPCGPKDDNNCTNFQGSYECGACGEGFLPDAKKIKKCNGMYKI